MIISNDTIDGPNVRKELHHEIYKVFIVNNVRSYDNPRFDVWNIDAPDGDIHSSGDTFLVIDTIYNEAFGHWVFECGIYLELFKILKSVYPNIKLKLKVRRIFKILFCKLFDIFEGDIVYELPPSNTCIFPSPISLQNDKTVHPEFRLQLERLFKYIGQIQTEPHEDISYLLMPRQTKENYASNDRKVPFNDIFTYFSDRPHINSKILHTDTVVDMKEQIRMVRSAKNIILTSGAAHTVNGLFSQNSNILVLGDLSFQSLEYPKVSMINQFIESINSTKLIICSNNNAVLKYL